MKRFKKFVGLYICVLLLLLAGGVKGQSVAVVGSDTVTADMVLTEAVKHLGKPYRWGGKGPNSFDCAGFVRYVYGKFGFRLGGSCVPQYAAGVPLTRGELERGDLVFFGGRSSSKTIGHVGIVTEIDLSDGSFEFIHAARTGIRYSSSRERYYESRYICACRLLAPQANLSWTLPDTIALDRYFDDDKKIYALMGGEDITDKLDANLVELEFDEIPLDTFSLAFVGEIMMRQRSWYGKVSSVSMPVDMKQRVGEADISFGVLNGVIGRCDNWFKRMFNSSYKHQMLPDCAMQMRYSGLDVLSLSGLHCNDLGDEGFLQTTRYLDSVGMEYAGGRESCMTKTFERNEYWCGYCSLLYDERFMDESLKHAQEVIRSLRDTVDVLVVNFIPVHPYNRVDSVMYQQRMSRFARTCVNYGADVVVGCSEMGGGYTELCNGRLIVYGLGSFCKEGLRKSPVASVKVLTDGTYVEGNWYELPSDGELEEEKHRVMNPKTVDVGPWGQD